MKVIIVGAGEVGYHIADRLSKEGHHVTIVEREPTKEKKLSDKVNALVVHGNGASATVLQKAGIESADLFIAVTDSDEVNLVACLIANEFKVPFKVARVKNIEYIHEDHILSAKSLGIDLLINPQNVVSDVICKIISYTEASEAAEFAGGKVIFISFPIHEKTPIVGKKLKDLSEERKRFDFIVPAITRKDQTLIPTGEDTFQDEDIVSFVCKKYDLEHIHELLDLKRKKAKTIFLLGGGQIGMQVAQTLQKKNHTIKIIEKNDQNCKLIAEKLDNVLVLCSDSYDVETLKAEGISMADAFIAVTNDDSANILGSLLAKKYGVRRSIALVNDPELVNLAPTLGVDACVSPRLATAGEILKYIRGEKVLKIAMLEQNDAEVIEFQITEKFKKLNKSFKEISIPDGILVGAIQRKGEIIIPSGGDHLEVDDHVVVFCLAETITKAEKYFS